ncbi:hypothetical protein [uncultured Gammaproteobacteria bacterium]|nr:hypothetical protein [uncultured Gammaproteobacteria bacterium]
MDLKTQIKKYFWKIGLDVSRFKSCPTGRRKALLKSYDIGLVLDIGANSGQFSKEIRNDIGYTGDIISFEPLSLEFKSLERKANKDKKWRAINCAIGNIEERSEINISRSSGSSSILNMLDAHKKSAPGTDYVGKEIINIKTLDGVMDDLSINEPNIYLKVDTQGYESRVIQGSELSLERIDTIQLEMALIPLYQDEMLFNDMCNLLYSKGYILVSIEPVFTDEASGQLLQVDGIFHRF